jgi:hypothetical protein
MKKLLLILTVTAAAALAVASDYVIGSGSIAVGDNFGVFGAAGATDGTRFNGGGLFAEVLPSGEVVRKVLMRRATSLTIVDGTLTMSGPGFVWVPGGWTLAQITMVLTDSPTGDSFSVTVGAYSASGPLLRGRIVSGSN